MKLVISKHVEKQLYSIGLEIIDLVDFLRLNKYESNSYILLCSPIKGINVYKAYLDRRRRAIFFSHDNGLIYPVYVGDKCDLIAKNITVKIVRQYAEIWQDKVLTDIEAKQYKVRHY
jgi:hypothetical protein